MLGLGLGLRYSWIGWLSWTSILFSERVWIGWLVSAGAVLVLRHSWLSFDIESVLRNVFSSVGWVWSDDATEIGRAHV